MKRGEEFELTLNAKWFKMLTNTLYVCDAGLLLCNWIFASIPINNITWIVSISLIPAVSVATYDIVRHWHKWRWIFKISLSSLALMLTGIVFLAVTNPPRGAPFIFWIAGFFIALLGLFCVTTAWLTLDIVCDTNA